MKIAVALPEKRLSNAALVKLYPEWTEEAIVEKTGIVQRRIAADGETALDLAEEAARRLFAAYAIDPASIDYLLLCTQSSEYRLPSTSCLLQHRLGLPTAAGAVTIDHGCSGYLYGLSLAKGLLAGGMASTVLFVTAETYSKYISPEDKTTRTLFGDGATATLLTPEDLPAIGAFSFGTDGSGAEKLIVRNGELFMDGLDIFNFTLAVVPKMIDDVLAKNHLCRDDIDLYLFHQANKFMLDAIRKVTALPGERVYINLEQTGNTVSNTLPIALKQLQDAGKIRPGMRILLMGFGVGLSWGATILTC